MFFISSWYKPPPSFPGFWFWDLWATWSINEGSPPAWSPGFWPSSCCPTLPYLCISSSEAGSSNAGKKLCSGWQKEGKSRTGKPPASIWSFGTTALPAPPSGTGFFSIPTGSRRTTSSWTRSLRPGKPFLSPPMCCSPTPWAWVCCIGHLPAGGARAHGGIYSECFFPQW